MQKIEIRRLGPEDCEGAAALMAAAIGEAWSSETLRERCCKDYDRTLVAYIGGEPAGIVAAELLLGEIAISIVATDERFRRKGVARALLTRLLSEPHDRAVLEVRVTNAPARALYKSLGFAEAGLRRGFYTDPDEDALVEVRAP